MLRKQVKRGLHVQALCDLTLTGWNTTCFAVVWCMSELGLSCGLYFPDQGLNPGPLPWEHSLNHWTTICVYVYVYVLEILEFL